MVDPACDVPHTVSDPVFVFKSLSCGQGSGGSMCAELNPAELTLLLRDRTESRLQLNLPHLNLLSGEKAGRKLAVV